MSDKIRKRAARGSALLPLLVAWAQGKLGEHPPRLGWLDLAVLVGLLVAWALGRSGAK